MSNKTQLICSKCGRDASIGTPGMDSTGNVICYICVREARDGVFRYGIEQRADSYGAPQPLKNPEFFLNGNTLRFRLPEVWKRTGNHRFGYSMPLWDVSAWVADGAAFPILPDEVLQFIANPLEFFNMVQRFEDQCLFRCTTCKKDLPITELGGRPLFAGKVCKGCWQKHIDHLDHQKKTGDVCLMCGEPRGNCSC